MTVELRAEIEVKDPPAEWEPPPPPDSIFDDGEPLETNLHRKAMNGLIRSMLSARGDCTDSFSSEQARNRDFRSLENSQQALQETEQALQAAEREKQATEQALQETQQALQEAIAKLRVLGLSAEQVAEALGLSVDEVSSGE